MKNLTISDLVRAVWRRRIWFMVPLVLGVAAAVAALQVLPRTYRAVTTVLVEPQKVPADYVKPTVTSSIEERLRTIEPQIKNRDNMERIIREMDLYPELKGRASMDQVLDQARRDLTVRLQGNTFYIYFVGRDPVKVARTANRVAEVFMDGNLRLRENQAQGTSTFLEAELAKTKHRLEVQEGKIAAFKRLNMGDLPEQRDTNLRGVEQLQTKLEINMDALDKAETRRLLLQSQIAELQRQHRSGSSRRSTLTGLSGSSSAPEPPSRLDQLRTQLAELRARYTDRHPDVIRAEAEIAQLEALEKARPARPSSSPASPGTAVAEVEDDDPARPDPMLKAEITSIDLEIRNLKNERERILSDTSRVQGRLEAVPRVEQELLSLTRDYDNIKNSYESLLDKRLNARLYENLEKSQQGESFTILERAQPPNAPYGPNKILVLGLGLIAGGLVGLLAALLRERSDPTYLDAESLQQAFPGLPLLATIPVFQGAGSTSRTRRR
ncbi:MAG TPA: GNVR domain-containing protein [Thermoanaerobaculia bacterium]|jgi:polysaccharide chain length determinant protein (PEP-CTERM system associated)|nr:GNVR domain-containing protein [Thermoanaerobaculia bacterium]